MVNRGACRSTAQIIVRTTLTNNEDHNFAIDGLKTRLVLQTPGKYLVHYPPRNVLSICSVHPLESGNRYNHMVIEDA